MAVFALSRFRLHGMVVAVAFALCLLPWAGEAQTPAPEDTRPRAT